MTLNQNDQQAFACDLTAIPGEAREEHMVDASQLFGTAQEVQELPNGYAIRFANQPGKFMEIAKFLENDRLCCPFFNFGVEVEPNGGPLWLRVTGEDGVKELLRITLFESKDEQESLKQWINTGNDPQLDKVVAQTELPLLTSILKQTQSD